MSAPTIITDEEMEQILSSHRAGATVRSLARKYHMGRDSMRNLIVASGQEPHENRNSGTCKTKLLAPREFCESKQRLCVMRGVGDACEVCETARAVSASYRAVDLSEASAETVTA